jgi:hypothetical protein
MSRTGFQFGKREQINYTLPDNSNLIHYYDLETGGVDHFGTADSGGVINMSFGPGLYGNGAIFNGIDSYISFPNNTLDSTGQFSVSFLAKADNTNAEYRIFAFAWNTGEPFVLFRLNAEGVAGRISLLLSDGTNREISTDFYDITLGLHLGCTVIENDKFKLFVNGNLVATYTEYGSFVQIAGGNKIGTNRNHTGNFLPGMMRGLGIWNTAISDAEMQGIAQKQLDGLHII